MRETIGAVITGGDFQALGAIRTLGRKGIPVVVLDKDHCIGKYSRYTKRFSKTPDPSDEETYVEFLISLAENEHIHGWVVFPNSDETVYVLSKHKKVLSKYYRIPTPDWDIIKHVYIKKNTYQLAEGEGIPVPKSYHAMNMDELLSQEIEFPVVMKPSIRDHFYGKAKSKAYLVKTRDKLKNTYERMCEFIDPSEVLVQEFIPGGPKNLYSFCPFFKEGKVITSVMGRRARQHPMDFGHASTFVECVDIPRMRELGEKFLRLIGFYGIAEVEFMADPRDNEFKLIEINPRLWGWHTLGIAAGVDFPYLLYKDMVGGEVEVQDPSRNMKWVRLVTDVPTVLLEVARGRMTVSEYVRSMKGKKEFAVLSIDDPLPFIAEIAMIPYLWIKRGF